MASTDITLKLDHEDRISFAHSPLSAFIFTLISLGFTWICWNFIQDAPTVRMFFVAFSLLFVLVGILGIFWRMEWDRGRKEILLPASGFNVGLVFLSLFGGVFVVLGGSFLLARLGIFDVPIEGSELSQIIIPPIFILAGLGIIWLGIRGSYSALVVGVENGNLFIQNLAFGKRFGRKSIPHTDIESVSVGGDIRSRNRSGGGIKIGGVTVGSKRYRGRNNEVVIRSDKKILRFGSTLTDAERTWLADACYFVAVRGQLP